MHERVCQVLYVLYIIIESSNFSTFEVLGDTGKYKVKDGKRAKKQPKSECPLTEPREGVRPFLYTSIHSRVSLVWYIRTYIYVGL